MKHFEKDMEISSRTNLQMVIVEMLLALTPLKPEDRTIKDSSSLLGHCYLSFSGMKFLKTNTCPALRI